MIALDGAAPDHDVDLELGGRALARAEPRHRRVLGEARGGGQGRPGDGVAVAVEPRDISLPSRKIDAATGPWWGSLRPSSGWAGAAGVRPSRASRRVVITAARASASRGGTTMRQRV
ncbi:MAG: hypothetical protein HS111_21695 [Kofleriaceae bacterium]|nr:hypothetical protein [Kofleriaceae bacterium]